MANVSLAVKHRPSCFEDVTEQEAIKVILREQIKNETFQHAYLFTGPAGCGKTTVARIFANDINGGKGNPIEIDAASNNGVDNVREIGENAKRKSLDSPYKVYIIDECHMLSTGAWNAMLKLLEESPAGTVFLMCTTDPQKIPATIISRVQRYDFSKIPLDKIVDRLQIIIGWENEEILQSGGPDGAIEFEKEALEYIAKLADGGMRDAITMLDKCLSLSIYVSVENAVKALGTVDYDVHFGLLDCLALNSSPEVVQIIEKVYNSGKDIKQFIKQFQYFMLDVLKYKMHKSFEYTQLPAIADYEAMIESFEDDDCLSILKLVTRVNADIKWESNAKVMIETALVLWCEERRNGNVPF